MVRYAEFYEELSEFCYRYGLSLPAVVGVTKTVEPDKIREAYAQGLREFGENRVQEARSKIPSLQDLQGIRWHMVGYLQRNKVRHALRLFQMIQSVDRLELVEALEHHLQKRSIHRYPILIEINTSGEPQKHGVDPERAEPLIQRVIESSVLELQGLMTVGPYPVTELRSRKAFQRLRTLRDQMEIRFGIPMPILSMGMTEDWPYALLEGSTMIRIGRAIFGERPT